MIGDLIDSYGFPRLGGENHLDERALLACCIFIFPDCFYGSG